MGNFSQVFKVLKRIDGCMYAVKHTTRQLHQDRKEESLNGSSSLGSSRVSGKHWRKMSNCTSRWNHVIAASPEIKLPNYSQRASY
ncbi:hypothetical protein SLEP1_g1294 [Rubroshorea leprosula]|uniref:Uncharacterized protein n=1 Tax=Rubroshorea leprosula TaxID=152421 RepID=A0AAV5HMF9_9ROSI|nr:hypothetical protein SLEP1_g1294 [Rubroshorea leprosula]